MRSTAIIALFALSLLPATALAQASPQAAAPQSATSASPTTSRSGGLTQSNSSNAPRSARAGGRLCNSTAWMRRRRCPRPCTSADERSVGVAHLPQY